MRVQVKDFQSIKEVTLEAEGLTVITGRSNVGKSALFRAMVGALFGYLGDHFVRSGQDHCVVGLRVEPDVVKWRKVTDGSKLKSVLDINGVVHTTVGRDHASLTAPLGFREIKTQSVKLRPQVAAQLEAPFLMMQTDTEIAEVFKVLGRVDTVTAAQAMAKKDRRVTEQKKEVREGDVKVAEAETVNIAGVEQLRSKWQELSKVMTERVVFITRREIEVEKLGELKSLVVKPVLELPVVKLVDWSLEQKLVRYQGLVEKRVPGLPTLPNLEEKHRVTRNLIRVMILNTETQQLLDELQSLAAETAVLGIQKLLMEKELRYCPLCRRRF